MTCCSTSRLRIKCGNADNELLDPSPVTSNSGEGSNTERDFLRSKQVLCYRSARRCTRNDVEGGCEGVVGRASSALPSAAFLAAA